VGGPQGATHAVMGHDRDAFELLLGQRGVGDDDGDGGVLGLVALHAHGELLVEDARRHAKAAELAAMLH